MIKILVLIASCYFIVGLVCATFYVHENITEATMKKAFMLMFAWPVLVARGERL